MRWLVLLLLVVGLLPVLACYVEDVWLRKRDDAARSPYVPPDDERNEWVGEQPSPTGRAWSRWFPSLRHLWWLLPEARQGLRDGHRYDRPVHAQILPSHNAPGWMLLLWGDAYGLHLADPGEAAPEAAAENRRWRESLRVRLPVLGAGAGGVLAVDREAPSGLVLDVVRDAWREGVGRFAFRTWTPGPDGHYALRWHVAEGGGSAASPGVPVRLDRAPPTPGALLVPRVRLGSLTVDFPPHDPRLSYQHYESPSSANGAWRQVRGAIRNARAEDPQATVEVLPGAESVPFAYLVKVLDLLLEAGARTIHLLPHDLRFDVDRDLPEPLPALDHGLPAPGAWVAAGAAFLAAFALGWGRRRRAATEPPSPERRST